MEEEGGDWYPRSMTLEEENAELRLQMRVLLERVCGLEEENARLKARLEALEGRKNPPPPWVKASTTPVVPRKGPRRPRPADQNKGRLKMEPTHRHRHAYEVCPECAHPLAGGSVKWTREVIEIPASVIEVHEHEFISRYCGLCQKDQTPKATAVLAGQVVGHSRMGVRLASLISTLRGHFALPLAKIRLFVEQFYGLRLSTGGLQSLLCATVEALAPVHEALRAETLRSSVLYMDETGWRETGVNGYIWAQTTPGPAATRLFTFDHHRSADVALRLLEGFDGVLVSDFYASYNAYTGSKQRCWAHLARDLHDLKEAHPTEPDVGVWCDAVMAVYQRATESRAGPSYTQEERRALARMAEQRVIDLGACYRRTETHPCHILAKRVHRFAAELVEYVAHPEVEATNNQAERAIRPFVTARKVSGGSRSAAGSRLRATLASLFHTWSARGLNPFHTCDSALRISPSGF